MSQLIIAGGIGAIGVMQGLILYKLRVIDTLQEKTTTLDTWAFGAKGNNGANKDITDLKTEVAYLRRTA